jgi:CRISPR-associated protein Csc3
LTSAPGVSLALQDFVEYVADKELLRYKDKIHIGGKEGESLWTHVMNLVMLIEQLHSLFRLTDTEHRCLLLALTIHDINKLDQYGKRANGSNYSYAMAARRENIRAELASLQVQYFLKDWEHYLEDVKYLADAHQDVVQPASQWHQKDHTLDETRLEGPLKFLMKVADVSDNTHSDNYMDTDEVKIRRKLREHLNAALNADNRPVRFRFIGYRLAELRGLFTNIIHNETNTFLRELFGQERCIDLMHHPEGVDYVLERQRTFTWTPELRHQLAKRVGKRFAALQAEKLAQFIQVKPSGITVDAAAMQSGAPIDAIIRQIGMMVQHKRYRLDWCDERERLVRQDFEQYLADATGEAMLQERVMQLLRESDLVSRNSDQLMRGEFLMACRNFLKDYREEQLKAVQQDAWTRASRLFGLPPEQDELYALVDPYRRAYAMARELPERTPEQMIEDALADLAELEMQAQSLRKSKQAPQADDKTSENEDDSAEALDMDAAVAFLDDYLERNLEVWDDQAGQPVQAIAFADALRRYSDPKRQYVQCCYCGSALRAEEWMSAQVPPNIGVQSFSNRLEAGSSREPKRNVCPICRTQFILEKLAWESHRDKQGGEQVTFYLHLFPYSYFTRPLLDAWWYSVRQLRDEDRQALWLHTDEFYTRYRETGGSANLKYTSSRLGGLGIPLFADAISNTPVLPFIASGSNYGKQFLVALEVALMLAQWFDCRVLLSRLPTPLLNLTHERRYEHSQSAAYTTNEQGSPIALLVENVPQAMNWLVPQNALTRNETKQLCERISVLHRLAHTFKLGGSDREAMIYDLVSAASGDPLEIYFEVDRRIEQAAQHNKNAEFMAAQLSQQVASLIKQLLEQGV